MPLLIKNATVYAPQALGKRDILIVHDRIAAMDKHLSVQLPELTELDVQGSIVTPGFIDQHIHVTGGGGEGGPYSRTPELFLSELAQCGTTSVVGVSGTDSVTRSMAALLAKVRALTFEGISAWMYTSNYALPPSLLTDSIRNDLFYVPEVLGVKIALGDHRSSFPTIDELMRILSDVRVGGMLAGKTGFLHIHLGSLPGAFDMLQEVLSRGMAIAHLRPTHCARTQKLFEQALHFAERGGVIDITSSDGSFDTPAAVITAALEAGTAPSRLTISSDGHGSLPCFDANGVMTGLGVGAVSSNLTTVQELIQQGINPEIALALVTSNVATHLGLPRKGSIQQGNDADLCFFDQHFTLHHVMAKGTFLMQNTNVCVKGTFEK